MDSLKHKQSLAINIVSPLGENSTAVKTQLSESNMSGAFGLSLQLFHS